MTPRIAWCRGAAALVLGGAAGLTAIPHSGALAAGAAPSGTLVPYTSTQVASVAVGGDTNPYSIAVIPLTMGKLVAGNVLVVDFNKGSTPGGGTTVLQVNPATGATSVFASGTNVTGPVGIAINPVNDGVWLGDFGSGDGTSSNDLLILPDGTQKALYDSTTVNANPGYSGPKPTFDGVWGEGVSKAAGQVSFYYGTTGSGATGTGGGEVWRIDPHPTGTANGQPVNSTYAEVATGLADNATAAALPVTAANAAGPQGFAYDSASGTLYVSNDADNSISSIPGAATASTPVTTTKIPVPAGILSSPENIAIDPTNGQLLVVNAGNNTLVEIDPKTGAVTGSRVLDTGATGALFGLAVVLDAAGHPEIFYVDDNSNTLNVLRYAAASSSIGPVVPATGAAVGPASAATGLVLMLLGAAILAPVARRRRPAG